MWPTVGIMNPSNCPLLSNFIHRGATINVAWFDIWGEDLPDLPWQQVYAVCDLDGLVPVVRYATGGKPNLPGGKLVAEESVDAAVKREIREELNCRVRSWYALGYQTCTEPDGTVVHQLRVRAFVSRVGEFISDPGGSVQSYSLVPLDKLNAKIGYGQVGDRMVDHIRSAENL